MPGKCGLGAAWHATHNDVQNLVLLAIIMLISLAVLAVDGVHRLFQLRHMLWRARIQRVLHHRLFGTSAPSEGCLQCPVGSQTAVDFDQSVRSCQHRNPSVIQLVDGRVLDRLLSNLHAAFGLAQTVSLLSLSLPARPGSRNWYTLSSFPCSTRS